MNKYVFSHAGLILKGFIILIIGIEVGRILFRLVWSILQDMMMILNAIVPNFFQNSILIAVTAVILLLIISWGMGKVSFSKALSVVSRKRGLFCVRIKQHLKQHSFFYQDQNFPWTYAIGVVMNEHEIEDLTYYNILFPNLAGMITLFDVPAEDTSRVEITPEDLMAASASLGMMRLRKHN